MLTIQDLEKHTQPEEFLQILRDKVPEDRLNDILYSVQYEKELLQLQGELVNLQQWVAKHQKRVCVIFEGRDAAGKGGSIRRFSQHLNPRSM